MSKGPMAWKNLYMVVTLAIGYTICARYRKRFTATSCPTRVPWFENFMRGSKLRMGVITKILWSYN